MFTGNAAPVNPNTDFEVAQTPDDSISALKFSPATMQQTYLVSGSWDNSVRCWEIDQSGQTLPKAIQSMTMAILDVCWSGDGTKVFMASCNKQVNCWDLASNQTMQVAAHDAPASICHWIETPSYKCIMTASWDKTLKFWDLRSSVPMMTINLHEKAYCADVEYPFAVIGTSSKGIFFCNLNGTPSISMSKASPFNYQHTCIALIRENVTRSPTGLALGNVGGGVGVLSNIIKPQSTTKTSSFRCHRRNIGGAFPVQDVYSVNNVKFHPVYGTMATVGSDGTYTFWEMETRTRLMASNVLNQQITRCCFNSNGQIFAYSTGYDWSKGHEYNDPSKKPKIFLRPFSEELKPKSQPALD